MRPAHRPWETAYNGWSWEERCAINPIQNAMFRSGQLLRPTICSICGLSDPARINTRGYVFAHTERYDRPDLIWPACKNCHAALHARFRDPARWQRVLRTLGRPGDWFTTLSLDPASQWRPFWETYTDGLPSPALPREGSISQQGLLL